MTAESVPARDERILGHARIDTLDFATLVSHLQPGEVLKLKPSERYRTVPILDVPDDSWRAGLAP